MINNILNITADGTDQELVAANGFPQRTRTVSMQASTGVVMYYRWRGQTTYWTIKAGAVRVLQGEFWPGDLFVRAAVGVVLEIEISTQLTI